MRGPIADSTWEAPLADTPPPGPGAKRRAQIVVALLVAEGLAVSLVYDVLDFLASIGASALRPLTLLPVVLVIAFVVLRPQRAAALPPSSGLRLHWLFVHAAALVTFVMTSDRLATIEREAVAPVAGIWFLSGALLVATLVLAAFSLETLRAFVARERAVFGLAAIVGCAAFATALLFEDAWPYLAGVTLQASGALLGVFYPGAYVEPASFVLGVGDFYVIVGEACSGGEGIGLIAMLCAAYLFVRRRVLSWPIAWVLLPAGVALAWVANVVRIVALTAVGVSWSPEIALAGFHSKAGWLLACVIGLLLTRVAERSFTRDARDARYDPSDAAMPLFLGPLLLTLALQLVTGLFVVDLDTFYPHRFVVVAAVTGYAALKLRPRFSASVVPALAGVVVFGLWYALADRGDAAAIAGRRAELAAFDGEALWIGARVLGSVIVVPVAEELAFRGYLLRRIVSEDFLSVSYRAFAPIAWLVSSLAFGALHSSFVAGTIAGVIFAAVAAYRGRLGDAVVAHSVANALVAVAVLLGDQWWLWL